MLSSQAHITSTDSSTAASDAIQTAGVCLVVGDWFVDEHWICGVHRSSMSSRTGRTHLRALHSPKSTVRAFCGAGRSALFLHHLYQRSNTEPLTFLIGLGFWHRQDTKELLSLFEPRSPAQTPYRLTSPDIVMPTGIELLNMNDALNFRPGKDCNGRVRTEQEHLRWRDEREYTTRIIRIYSHGERDQVVYDRLDWEPKTPIDPLTSARVYWTDEQKAELFRLFKEQLGERSVQSVVIKDMQKGAINDQIIDWLVGVNEWLKESGKGDPQWFVSTKKWRASWLNKLGKKVDLRLVMIPPVAAKGALRDDSQKLSRWITRSGRASKEAIKTIDDFAAFTNTRKIVVLPEEFCALACACNEGKVLQCAVQSKPRPEKVSADMGFASILFPALVACFSSHRFSDDDIKPPMELALRSAFEWVESEALRVVYPRTWSADPATWPINPGVNYLKHIVNELDNESLVEVNYRNEPRSFGDIQAHSWKDEQTEWLEAYREVGIVGRKNGVGGSLELWRAMLEVDGYVCCEESMRDQLRRLLRRVQFFTKNRKYHTSCMLVASPGSGKTFLAKSLARTCGLRFIPFNITQMRSKAEIIECLDTIVATQAENAANPLMVFIDEINAKLENAPVYGAFLTPLEDGTYVHSGRTFNIRPCVWVFAGTRHPESDDSQKSNPTAVDTKPEKGSDFASRLTLGVINVTNASAVNTEDSLDEASSRRLAKSSIDMRAIEQVYLGVSTLRHEFPDVRQVSEVVLRAFWELPHEATVREIKHFVRRFRDIQYGEVTARSVPDRWPEDSGDLNQTRWRSWWVNQVYSDKADVRIVT